MKDGEQEPTMHTHYQQTYRDNDATLFHSTEYEISNSVDDQELCIAVNSIKPKGLVATSDTPGSA